MTAPAPSDDSPAARRRRFADLTPLRASPAFARLWAGSAISGIGAQLTVVAVGLQVYDITRSTFAVSLVGGVALVPMIVAGLWGGMLADSFDRRTVAIISAVVGWLATLGLRTHRIEVDEPALEQRLSDRFESGVGLAQEVDAVVEVRGEAANSMLHVEGWQRNLE